MLLVEHFRATMLGLIRTPAYSASTILIPSLVFLFLGATFADTREAANLALGSISIFAVLGIAFFQFGVGIANERLTPWEAFVRILPVPRGTRFAAMILSGLAFTMAALTLLAVVALVLTDAGMAPGNWVLMLASLMIGAVPMAMLGIAIGYWCEPKAALPIANILNLALAFAGGLFFRPEFMPGFLEQFSLLLPTRHIGELTWAAILDHPWPIRSLLWLAGYTVAFAALAAWGYRRDEGTRYR